ncbi:unnamed protein product [Tilletia controversa]
MKRHRSGVGNAQRQEKLRTLEQERGAQLRALYKEIKRRRRAKRAAAEEHEQKKKEVNMQPFKDAPPRPKPPTEKWVKKTYFDDHAEDEDGDEERDDGDGAGNKKKMSRLFNDRPVARTPLSVYMRSTDHDTNLSELLQRRRPPTYEQTTANALAVFTPNPNIRRREDRVPQVIPKDPYHLRLMQKCGLIE